MLIFVFVIGVPSTWFYRTVMAYQTPSGSKGGGIHRISSLGNLIDFRLLPSQAHDLQGTTALLEGLVCGQFLADRASDANWLRDALTRGGIEAVIPPKSNRKYPAEFDNEACKWGHLVDNFFAKLKEYRGIAMRCCKTDKSFGAFIALAATVIRPR